ncbi:Putative aminoacrylate hydrolase RutD [Vibrio aerogenes CECT 7868]|uniref:Putative aminoacrylate hydrolase RutD n=1 Tax=Vibrio aerogenes CECT 7868 TaxID=1216006 RepID=A0A1M5XBI1_9VIBR|nr:alpha/beta hydrolase [Vibrio aerogenes]SHH97180.1 Putative aminoacrylate hydrolase RutD [Vibrio aerogenes CECT 7868]
MNQPIVLLRGLFRSQFHWGIFPQILQDLYPERSVVCLDIPGAGKRHNEISPSSVRGMVESLRADFNGAVKLDIIAVSMGGMIALKWAELYPDQVASVICINTTAAGFSPFWQRLLPDNYIRLIVALFSGTYQRESVIFRLVSNQPSDDRLIEQWVATDKQYPMRRMNFFRQLYAAATFEVSRPACPLLFISSAQDRLVCPEATQAIAHAWRERLIINEQDGHDIPLDNPQWLCRHVSPWLHSGFVSPEPKRDRS